MNHFFTLLDDRKGLTPETVETGRFCKPHPACIPVLVTGKKRRLMSRGDCHAFDGIPWHWEAPPGFTKISRWHDKEEMLLEAPEYCWVGKPVIKDGLVRPRTLYAKVPEKEITKFHAELSRENLSVVFAQYHALEITYVQPLLERKLIRVYSRKPITWDIYRRIAIAEGPLLEEFEAVYREYGKPPYLEDFLRYGGRKEPALRLLKEFLEDLRLRGAGWKKVEPLLAPFPAGLQMEVFLKDNFETRQVCATSPLLAKIQAKDIFEHPKFGAWVLHMQPLWGEMFLNVLRFPGGLQGFQSILLTRQF